MKRIVSLTIVACLSCALCPTTGLAQGALKKTKKGIPLPGRVVPQETLVRDTYRKLEQYSAAAQQYRNEFDRGVLRAEANLKLELSDFSSGSIQDILNLPYPRLITMPTGEVIGLGHGTYSLDDGPAEATFNAAWERGAYASGNDPSWTVSDVLNFEPEKYFDIVSYVSYQVTVTLEGRSRTYRAIAVFHKPTEKSPLGVPVCWHAIVNGLNRVFEEKVPPYKRPQSDKPDNSEAKDQSLISANSTGFGRMDTSSELPLWLVGDYTEHASGWHFGTSKYRANCTTLPGSLQRCSVTAYNFTAEDTGGLDHILLGIWYHRGTKDERAENRTAPSNTAISCAAITGVAF